MSKVKLIKSIYPLHSELWHKDRLSTIGASEVGALLGLNPYMPAARLFAEKSGILERQHDANRFSFWGLTLEEIIADVWRYYDGKDENSYVVNKNENKLQREFFSPEGKYIHDDFNWLSSTPDKMIKKGQFSLFKDIPVLEKDCPMDCKNINDYAYRQWEGGIPIYYLAQLFTQMITTDTDYSELVMLRGGNTLTVQPIIRSQEFVNIIIEKSSNFWFKKVLPARKLVEEMKKATSEKQKEEISAELARLEPSPQESQGYVDFLKERYKTQPSSREITIEEYKLAVEFNEAQEREKQAKDVKDFAKSKLIFSMKNVEIIEDSSIKVTHRNREGERGYFSVKIKKLSDESQTKMN